ncbi:hypothetical protein F511_46728 [Dorcoceras hygrometricum]|uniref:Uncharacterized protein n=1 Tax=Dorcoceras hygrometricum TaxID=472368 RepID=A0A2Z6ZST2_9LAMI|nr:hypothetical protein F511_46728 [Dorcoceras hygrometricum]
MQHAINQCYEYMRAIKDRIARPASRLAIISIEPLYHAQQVSGGNHRSVIFRARQLITARWYSDTTDQSVTTPMIALDFSGTTSQTASHNVALNQSDRLNIKFITSVTAMSTLKAVKSAQFVPSILKFYLTDSSNARQDFLEAGICFKASKISLTQA